MKPTTRSILSYLGIFLMIVGGILLVPIPVALFYPDEVDQIKYFALPGTIAVFVGYVLLYFNRHYHNSLQFDRNSLWLIVLVWVMAILVAAMPFWLLPEYHFTHAVFEAASGLSTTGLSVMDVASTSHLFLFYRSELQFFGGVGLVLVFVSILSKQNTYAIYTAEGHDDQLSPNLVKSARRIIGIYLSFILIGTILLTLFGMSVFDAINHAIAAISTGGFSTQVDSIHHYQSLAIELVIIGLMLLGGTNFLIHHHILTRRAKSVRGHVEFQYVVFVLLVLVPLFAIAAMSMVTAGYGEALRVTLFQFVSAATTTGFASVPSLTAFSSLFLLMMISLMVIGGGIGSTAGGIKQFRFIVVLKSVYWYFRESVSSKRLVYKRTIHKINRVEEVSDKMLTNTYVFVLLYLGVLLMGSAVFLGYGYPLQDSVFETSSALGTVGLSLGLFSYTSPPVILWMGSILMFLGRLEILIVLLSIANWIHRLRK
jgi:trk system potassium uptake protein TrkH